MTSMLFDPFAAAPGAAVPRVSGIGVSGRLKIKFSRGRAVADCAERQGRLISCRMNKHFRLFAVVTLSLWAGIGAAQGAEQDVTVPEPFEMIRSAAETTLDDWVWLRRPIVVFADNAADPRFVQQMALLTERLDALEERDVVVITDTDPAARTSVRQKLRPRGFALTIIAKDGTIIARKPSPWSVREITRSIDKQPLRQQEVRERRDSLR